MSNLEEGVLSRRMFGKVALTLAGGAIAMRAGAVLPPEPGLAGAPMPAPVPSSVVRPALFRRAMAALQVHGGRITRHDRIAVVDFAAPSSQPRMHIVDLAARGRTTSFLVAHGSGSDPAHTGWLQRFSNEPNSNATSSGAFLTDEYYVGKHGRSQRLIGLDASNSNVLERGIVVHSAWYSNPDMIAQHGMLGRSQGCFAVGERDLDVVFAQLGPGRMIYADKA